MTCNICGSTEFEDYRGRPAERCKRCGSKARHRIGLHVYQSFLGEHAARRPLKVLHLAPEACLVPALQSMFGGGYICADASPERYPHVKCLKLFFPRDFAIFPDGYFDVVLHNHVLEHIPGHYGDHLNEFARILAPSGQMILSVPGPYLDRDTVEGGEHMETDAERLEAFLQEDHLKLLGRDFVKYLENMNGGQLVPDGITDTLRASVNVRPGKAPYFIWQKDD